LDLLGLSLLLLRGHFGCLALGGEVLFLASSDFVLLLLLLLAGGFELLLTARVLLRTHRLALRRLVGAAALTAGILRLAGRGGCGLLGDRFGGRWRWRRDHRCAGALGATGARIFGGWWLLAVFLNFIKPLLRLVWLLRGGLRLGFRLAGPVRHFIVLRTAGIAAVGTVVGHVRTGCRPGRGATG
jgi:hypothetical protein